MPVKINEHIEVLNWKEAQPIVRKSDPELFKIIEAISPSEKFKFIRVRYPYGTTILHKDILYLPDQPYQTTPLKFADVPDQIKDDLGYRSVPFGMITENSIEIFKEYADKVFCVTLSGPAQGIELGIFESLGLTTFYNVTAGARSVYMIPKISETRHHKNLVKQYNLQCHQPKNILKHWNVFKSLYATGNMETVWETEIVFLNKEWDSMIDDPSIEWKNLKNYIYKKSFEHSKFGRIQIVLSLIWEEIIAFITKEGIKPDPYTIDTLKHLVHVYVGATPAYRPIINDFPGPLTEIQRIYIETYGIEQIPTIMCPYRFNLQEDKPVYYSMQQQSLLTSVPNLRKQDTIVQEMNSLNYIKDFVVSNLSDIGNIIMDEDYFSDLMREMRFNYYHADMYSYGQNIRPTKEIPESDPDFLFCPKDIGKKLPFAENGAFIKGCVKISRALKIQK